MIFPSFFQYKLRMERNLFLILFLIKKTEIISVLFFWYQTSIPTPMTMSATSPAALTTYIRHPGRQHPPPRLHPVPRGGGGGPPGLPPIPGPPGPPPGPPGPPGPGIFPSLLSVILPKQEIHPVLNIHHNKAESKFLCAPDRFLFLFFVF